MPVRLYSPAPRPVGSITGSRSGTLASLGEFAALGSILAALIVLLLKLRASTTPDVLLSVRSQIAPILMSWSSVLLLLLGASFTLKISSDLSRGWALSFAIALRC